MQIIFHIIHFADQVEKRKSSSKLVGSLMTMSSATRSSSEIENEVASASPDETASSEPSTSPPEESADLKI